MSDQLATTNQRNVTPLDVDDTVKRKLIVVIEGDEVQIDYETLDLTIDSSESDIMLKVVSIVQEEKGIDITDTYKVRKAIENENIYIYPNSTAG